MKQPRGSNGKLYAIYVIATLVGLVIARFNAYPAMRYVFLYYLIGLFLFTGALPYLGKRVPRGEPGFIWNAFIKISFPIIAVAGVALIVALLIKVRQ